MSLIPSLRSSGLQYCNQLKNFTVQHKGKLAVASLLISTMGISAYLWKQSRETASQTIDGTLSFEKPKEEKEEQYFFTLPSGFKFPCEQQGALSRAAKTMGSWFGICVFLPINVSYKGEVLSLAIQLKEILDVVGEAQLTDQFGKRLVDAANKGNNKEFTHLLDELGGALFYQNRADLFSGNGDDFKDIYSPRSFFRNFQGDQQNAQGKFNHLSRKNSYVGPTKTLRAPIKVRSRDENVTQDSYPCKSFQATHSTKETGGEDYSFTINPKEGGTFQAVFDGHNDQGMIGKRAEELFEEALSNWDPKSGQSEQEFLQEKVAEFEKQLWDMFNDPSVHEKWVQGGATFVASWVPPGSKIAYVMSLGDCQGFLFRDGEMYALSPDAEWDKGESKGRIEAYLEKAQRVPGNKGMAESLSRDLEAAKASKKNLKWPGSQIPKATSSSGSFADFHIKYTTPPGKFEEWLISLTLESNQDDIRRTRSAPLDPQSEGVFQMINNTPFIVPVELKPGDSLVLVSDGVTASLKAETLRDFMGTSENAESFFDQVVKAITDNNQSEKDSANEVTPPFQDDIGLAMSTFSIPEKIMN